MIAPSKAKKSFQSLGLKLDHLMKYYFCGNAILSIVVLVLITIFLFRAGIGVFPQNLSNLRLYREAGLEYVDVIRGQTDDHTALSRFLQDERQKQLTQMLQQGQTQEQATQQLAGFDQFIDGFDSSVDGLRSLLSDLTDMATALKDKAVKTQDSGGAAPDFHLELAPLLGTFPLYQETNLKFRQTMETLLAAAPPMPVPEFQPMMEKFKRLANQYASGFPAIEQKLKTWNPDKPIPWYRAVTSFLFGKEWITNSFWQDFYGVIPLLVGSVLVSFVALLIAVPFGVCSAVYVNEFASIHEQRFIKPYIEFISAIPSVVLGFFGIAVLGESLRQASAGSLHWIPLIPWDRPPFSGIEQAFAWCISWIPGFPMTERLNVFTAGALLALMAIPTIFSLSEDALNNVPRGFKEASYALGATRLQT
ncbi:MAG: ABC transporter permease subunit, partial [Verrucomicrobiota bacterium]